MNHIPAAKTFILSSLLIFCAAVPSLPVAEPGPAQMKVRKIWDAAPHNAFTDLLRFGDRWLCVFREGTNHVSPDGAVRVIASPDGETWSSIARLTHSSGDLRDPKITVAPDGQLMLTAAVVLKQPAFRHHLTLAWFSRQGSQWSEPVPIGETNFWLWRVTWHQGTAYGVGYGTTTNKYVRLYDSKDGRAFNTLVPRLFANGFPNEHSVVFLPDDTALCLLRRDGQPVTGLLGSARPPYLEWQWKDLGVKIGGPHMVRLPDGRLVAGVRFYDGSPRTALAWLDPETARLTEFLKLPSGGDTSYPGMVWHGNQLWVSYYSSHEGKTSIYFAKVNLPARAGE